MPYESEDRQLVAVVRRLLGEATDEADGPLRNIADHMLGTVGPPEHTKASARRYARAVINAAAVDARLEELTEKLAEAEWYARHAEAVADRLVARLDLGDQQVVATGLEDEISPDINALVSLADGQVWVRDQTVYAGGDESKYWLKAEASERGSVRHEWPIDGGPFIALPEHWHLRNIVQQARRRDELEDRVRSKLRGTLKAGTRYDFMAGLEQLLDLVLEQSRDFNMRMMRERDHAHQQLHDIRRIHSSPNTPVERHEQTMEVLARKLDQPVGPPAPAVPRCYQCGHQPHHESGCFNMASDNDCDCKADSLGGPVYDGDSDRTL